VGFSKLFRVFRLGGEVLSLGLWLGITLGVIDFSGLRLCPTNGRISIASVRDFFFHPHFLKNKAALVLPRPRAVDFSLPCILHLPYLGCATRAK